MGIPGEKFKRGILFKTAFKPIGFTFFPKREILGKSGNISGGGNIWGEILGQTRGGKYLPERKFFKAEHLERGCKT